MSILFFWCVWCVLGGLLARGKHRVVDGIMWGLLLGPIGLIIVLFLGDAWPKCPACRRHLDPEASICPYCKEALGTACRDGVKVAAPEDVRAEVPPALPAPQQLVPPKPVAASVPGRQTRGRHPALDVAIVMVGLALLVLVLCRLLAR